MTLEKVNPEQGNAQYMFTGIVTEQYELNYYEGSINIATLTKEEYRDGSFMWFSIIDGDAEECGDSNDFSEIKSEFFRIFEDYVNDKINYYTELLDHLKDVEEVIE